MLRDIGSIAPRIKQDENGILYFYDKSRSNFFSTAREPFTFGVDHSNISHDRWMMATSRVNTVSVGYKIPRYASITSITIQTKNNVQDCYFNILKNNNPAVITSISLINESSKSIDNLDIRLNKNDWLQSIIKINSGTVDYPILLLELAWVESKELNSTCNILSNLYTPNLYMGTIEVLLSSIDNNIISTSSTPNIELEINLIPTITNITPNINNSILSIGTIEELSSSSNITTNVIGDLLYSLKASCNIITNIDDSILSFGIIEELSSSSNITTAIDNSTLSFGVIEELSSSSTIITNIDNSILNIGTIEVLLSSINNNIASISSTPNIELEINLIPTITNITTNIPVSNLNIRSTVQLTSTVNIVSNISNPNTELEINLIPTITNITTNIPVSNLNIRSTVQLTSTVNIVSNIPNPILYFIDYTSNNVRGIFSGGLANTTLFNNIDYITISNKGNSNDFGNLEQLILGKRSISNGANNRGVFGGGQINSGSSNPVNVISYVTITSLSNTSDFGDLIYKTGRNTGTSNGTSNRGIFAVGVGYNTNTIEYITISSIGNSTDFGDLTGGGWDLGSTSNGTNNRGIFAGGYVSGSTNVINYITISTLGNSNDFGDLLSSASKIGITATSNLTSQRGIFAGGVNASSGGPINTIEYITISTLGNSNDFGDLTISRGNLASCSDGTYNRAVFATGSGLYNTIDYISIISIGDASDFGDIANARYYISGTSNA